nr:hypothetical protein [Tanacetum cinerariifolium]
SWAEDGEAGVGWAAVRDCWAACSVGCCWCGNASICPIVDVVRVGFGTVGELRRKKLRTMAALDKHDHLTSTKIKNENERQMENTRASSKSKLLDRKSCKEVEIPAKKRKLKN